MATRVDLNGMKEQIRAILEAANTTTASPIDLSANLANIRVQKILKINPELIPPQASFYPFVTCYIPNKAITPGDIAKNQASAFRRGRITLEIAAAVWNDTYKRATEDPADEDINYLMENIELILRSNETLNAKTLWQVPSGVAYYSAVLDQQTHIRAGIMTLECQIFY